MENKIKAEKLKRDIYIYYYNYIAVYCFALIIFLSYIWLRTLIMTLRNKRDKKQLAKLMTNIGTLSVTFYYVNFLNNKKKKYVYNESTVISLL